MNTLTGEIWKTVLAEKHSVAQDIARAIGATEKREGYYEGNGYYVTWSNGHLLELRCKESEGPSWTLDNLPIIPETFELVPIIEKRDSNGLPIPKTAAVHRLEIIKDLFQRSTSIVCATDAGREGQLIFDEIYRYLGINIPVQRLWISSFLEEDVKEGFANLQDNNSPHFVNMTKAARQRAEADWLVGVNATRALTVGAGSKKRVLSVGRVQTPTLRLICERYVEHQGFRPQPYWFLEGVSVKDGVEFRWKGFEPDRYTDVHQGNSDLNAVKTRGMLTVRNIKTERKREQPPLLHDITSLQRLANSRYEMTAKETLDVAQSLYEKKLITYPRTDSHYIPESVFAKVPGLLKSLRFMAGYGDYALALSEKELNRQSVDNDKVTDHYALLVTGKRPESLSDEETRIYELVAQRFVEAFSPVCIADVTTVVLACAGVTFKAHGRKNLSLGWKSVNEEGLTEDSTALNDADAIEMAQRPLPELKEGEMVRIEKIALTEDKTKPKPLFTENTLLYVMDNADKFLDNNRLAAALKGIGLGTKATRGDIIHLLVERNYVFYKNRSMLPTELGLSLYSVLKDKQISDIEMTAKWELSLSSIADGRVEEYLFEQRIRNYTRKITSELCSPPSLLFIREKLSQLETLCPKCGEPLRFGTKSVFCVNCKYTVWRNVCGKELTDLTLKNLITKGQTGLIKGFKNKSGDEFAAALKLKEDGNVEFIFPSRNKGGN